MSALTLPALTTIYLSQQQLMGRALAVLSAWALLNLVGSGYFLAHTDRREPAFYFHGMNVGWGLVNAALACWGVLHLQFSAPADLQVATVVQEQLDNENLFLFNAGLDAAYIMTGFYLRALAVGPLQLRPARLAGFGRALWVQGGFLLVFDAAVWGLLHMQGQGWLRLLE